jgi:hypothetical protein
LITDGVRLGGNINILQGEKSEKRPWGIGFTARSLFEFHTNQMIAGYGLVFIYPCRGTGVGGH